MSIIPMIVAITVAAPLASGQPSGKEIRLSEQQVKAFLLGGGVVTFAPNGVPYRVEFFRKDGTQVTYTSPIPIHSTYTIKGQKVCVAIFRCRIIRKFGKEYFWEFTWTQDADRFRQVKIEKTGE